MGETATCLFLSPVPLEACLVVADRGRISEQFVVILWWRSRALGLASVRGPSVGFQGIQLTHVTHGINTHGIPLHTIATHSMRSKAKPSIA